MPMGGVTSPFLSRRTTGRALESRPPKLALRITRQSIGGNDMAPSVAIPSPPLRQSELRRKNSMVPGALSRGFGWLAAQITDERLIVLLAAVVSVCAYAWYTSRGLTLGYADALSRMEIARRVLSSRTPGLTQLGTTWLPLQPMLMLPLIWNNTLFHDGFAGSFPSMVAYVISSLYMYKLVRLAFSTRAAAWVAALALMLNPSVVYMQATAMSEVPMICTATVAIYYMLAWVRWDDSHDLIKSAAAVAAGTGIRYDGWPLAVVFGVIVVYLAWRRQGAQGAQAWGIMYGLLAFSGCAAWIIYNLVVFHDPLLFLFFGNSNNTINLTVYPSHHHAWLSLEMYGYAAAGMVGWVTTALAAVGLIIFVVRYRLQACMLPVYGLLIPFAFYCLTFYLGWDTILLPQLGGGDTYWNARFGLQLVPAMAFFLAYLVTFWRRTFCRRTLWRRTLWRRTFAVIAVGVVACFAVTDSIGRTPFAEREPLAASHGTTPKLVAQWFAYQYRGGNVLISYIPNAPEMFYMMQYIPDRNFITDSNGPQFMYVLKHPQRSVKWVVMEENDNDNKIWVTLHKRKALQKYFVLRKVLGSAMFYERIGDEGAGVRRGRTATSPASAQGPPISDDGLVATGEPRSLGGGHQLCAQQPGPVADACDGVSSCGGCSPVWVSTGPPATRTTRPNRVIPPRGWRPGRGVGGRASSRWRPAGRPASPSPLRPRRQRRGPGRA